jgi:hypothetical protein
MWLRTPLRVQLAFDWETASYALERPRERLQILLQRLQRSCRRTRAGKLKQFSPGEEEEEEEEERQSRCALCRKSGLAAGSLAVT